MTEFTDDNMSGGVDTGAPIEIGASLEAVAAKLRKLLADSDTGPLKAAATVVDLADHWDRYRGAAGGKNCASWLRMTLGAGKHLKFFRDRHRAVQVLGKESVHWLNHALAVWIANAVASGLEWNSVRFALRRKFKENGNNPLSSQQGRRLVLKITGKNATPHSDTVAALRERVAQLEDYIRSNGLPVPE